MKHIEITEQQIANAFNKIRSGDRTDLLNGTMFNTKIFAKLSNQELMEIRRYIKKSITNLQILNETADMQTAKDCSLKLALYDQMKYEIKNLMEPKLAK